MTRYKIRSRDCDLRGPWVVIDTRTGHKVMFSQFYDNGSKANAQKLCDKLNAEHDLTYGSGSVVDLDGVLALLEKGDKK